MEFKHEPIMLNECLENLMKINSIAPMFLTSQLINLIKENMY